MRRLLAPSQAACFGEDSSAIQRAIESRQQMTTTALASRFIIEFITASPPSGTTHMSVATYDRMLALATQIIELGYLSDATRYGLSSTELSILASGRLGSSRDDPFHQTIRIYTERITGRSLNVARRAYTRHWASHQRDDDDAGRAELDAAFLAEFGVTATEHAHLAGDLMQAARDARRQIATRRREELVAALSASLGWTPDKVRRGLDLMELGPLDAFPPLKNPVDVYPWRFSRERAATRRPLYVRHDSGGEPEIVWGPAQFTARLAT